MDVRNLFENVRILFKVMIKCQKSFTCMYFFIVIKLVIGANLADIKDWYNYVRAQRNSVSISEPTNSIAMIEIH